MATDDEYDVVVVGLAENAENADDVSDGSALKCHLLL